jgi:heme exporter protein CcmD
MIDTLLHMGGYAIYVWPAYGLALVAFVGMYVLTRHSLKARTREFEKLKRERRDGP